MHALKCVYVSQNYHQQIFCVCVAEKACSVKVCACVTNKVCVCAFVSPKRRVFVTNKVCRSVCLQKGVCVCVYHLRRHVFVTTEVCVCVCVISLFHRRAKLICAEIGLRVATAEDNVVG